MKGIKTPTEIRLLQKKEARINYFLSLNYNELKYTLETMNSFEDEEILTEIKTIMLKIC
jgi:hypothetical protein